MHFRYHTVPASPDELGDTMPEDPHAALSLLAKQIPQVLDAPSPTIEDGSRMASDRAASTDLIDLPTMCEHYLGGSEDFLKALSLLMMPKPNTFQLPRFSLYPLIRGVIESSGQTAWVLGPDDQRQRFVRLLRLQQVELKSDVRLVNVRTRIQEGDSPERRSQLDALRTDADRKRQIRWQGMLDAAAALLGIDECEFKGGLTDGYEGVIREAVAEQRLDKSNGRWSAATWVFVSGLCHPSMSRAWAGSIRKPTGERADGSISVLSEANPAIVRDAFGLALTIHARAAVLMKQACASPPSAGDG